MRSIFTLFLVTAPVSSIRMDGASIFGPDRGFKNPAVTKQIYETFPRLKEPTVDQPQIDAAVKFLVNFWKDKNINEEDFKTRMEEVQAYFSKKEQKHGLLYSFRNESAQSYLTNKLKKLRDDKLVDLEDEALTDDTLQLLVELCPEMVEKLLDDRDDAYSFMQNKIHEYRRGITTMPVVRVAKTQAVTDQVSSMPMHHEAKAQPVAESVSESVTEKIPLLFVKKHAGISELKPGLVDWMKKTYGDDFKIGQQQVAALKFFVNYSGEEILNSVGGMIRIPLDPEDDYSYEVLKKLTYLNRMNYDLETQTVDFIASFFPTSVDNIDSLERADKVEAFNFMAKKIKEFQ